MEVIIIDPKDVEIISETIYFKVSDIDCIFDYYKIGFSINETKENLEDVLFTINHQYDYLNYG